jgi:hypothetical protein
MLSVALMAAMTVPGTPPVRAASLTISGIVDGATGVGYDADARFNPTENWAIAAGVGHSESNVAAEDFAGTTVRLGSDWQFRGFNAALALQQWQDSDQVKSTSTRGQIGWTALNGFGLAALLDDRRLAVDYNLRTLTGGTRAAQVNFNGTGLGAEVSWLDEQWNLGVRYVDYRYGRSMARVRAILAAPTTADFPVLERLLNSVLTRAAGAPDREVSATVGRQLSRSSLQGEWTLTRDALTRQSVHGVAVTHGYQFNRHAELDTTLGATRSGPYGTTAFGGVALTLRN